MLLYGRDPPTWLWLDRQDRRKSSRSCLSEYVEQEEGEKKEAECGVGIKISLGTGRGEKIISSSSFVLDCKNVCSTHTHHERKDG